jgi:hypothetical protein
VGVRLQLVLLQLELGGAKKISESSLLDRNSCSISGVVLNDACSTSAEMAFHTDVFPARWLKIGLQLQASKHSINSSPIRRRRNS